MKINLVAFGIAKDILKTRTLKLEIGPNETIAILKLRLTELYPELTTLKSLSFAVGDNYQDDSYTLQDQDEVVIIPPVSGG
jgi:molybdopterin converting factor small subunit